MSVFLRSFLAIFLCSSIFAQESITVIRNSSIYDYPQAFEEIYERDVMTSPPALIADFVERPAS